MANLGRTTLPASVPWTLQPTQHITDFKLLQGHDAGAQAGVTGQALSLLAVQHLKIIAPNAGQNHQWYVCIGWSKTQDVSARRTCRLAAVASAAAACCLASCCIASAAYPKPTDISNDWTSMQNLYML